MSNKEWRKSLNFRHSFEMGNETVKFVLMLVSLLYFSFASSYDLGT